MKRRPPPVNASTPPHPPSMRSVPLDGEVVLGISARIFLFCLFCFFFGFGFAESPSGRNQFGARKMPRSGGRVSRNDGRDGRSQTCSRLQPMGNNSNNNNSKKKGRRKKGDRRQRTTSPYRRSETHNVGRSQARSNYNNWTLPSEWEAATAPPASQMLRPAAAVRRNGTRAVSRRPALRRLRPRLHQKTKKKKRNDGVARRALFRRLDVRAYCTDSVTHFGINFCFFFVCRVCFFFFAGKVFCVFVCFFLLVKAAGKTREGEAEKRRDPPRWSRGA